MDIAIAGAHGGIARRLTLYLAGGADPIDEAVARVAA
jgi:hypothetical protein